MLFINSTTTNPYINIATEEYLLRNFTEDIIFIYSNTPSIIVGKHQNTLEEINLRFVIENNIDVVRRLSGGGTVYHDNGNLNFTFIRNGETGKLIDFKKYTQPVIDYLKSIGAEAYLGTKNEIRIGKDKVSGNAEHIYKNRVMHHGTLLFNSELTVLNNAIKREENRYKSKAVQSNRTNVANISDLIKINQDFDSFRNSISLFFKNYIKNTKEYKLNTDDNTVINSIAENRYRLWSWNFGYSPKYNVKGNFINSEFEFNTNVTVENGVIKSVDIIGNKTPENLTKVIKESITDREHNFHIIYNLINNKLKNSFADSDMLNICYSLF